MEVHGWPGHNHANWRMFTVEQSPQGVGSNTWTEADAKATGKSPAKRGRIISAVGWHKFKPHQQVGHVLLHVEGRDAVLITRMVVADTLVGNEALEVQTTLLACTIDIGQELHAKGIGNGCVDWQVSRRDAGTVCALFPDFKPHRHRKIRGQSVLRCRQGS